MNHNELEAIYFPGWYPIRNDIIAAASIYFARVHFVTPSINAKSTDACTDYLREVSTKSVTIQVFGKPTEETDPTVQKITQFWAFIKHSGPLLGEVIRYHPSLIAQDVSSIIAKLFGGGLPLEEWSNFVKRSREESKTLAKLYKGTQVLDDDFLSLVLPTTRYLAIQHGWIPLSDDPNLPAPVLQKLDSSADELATSLALRMLNLTLPAPQSFEPELLLKLRDEMSDELTSFRMMALKLAAELRKLLSHSSNREELEREADFLVKTRIMPYVEEIRRKIQVERGKFWRRLFGKTPKWISLGFACFSDPTGAALAASLREASKDAGSLLDDAYNLSLAGDPGVALLLQLEDTLNSQCSKE